ncbi:chemotaxis protein CheA [Nitrosopumilus ureiphilus]|uniref:chemotaxis protein CheA n=1 Tax=Nitrosopumilus ureiphilus TaxID=1470067 RepID=UPI0015C8D7F5|nr:chemotaxis protein CheA [Nitrosopumilus ureiphilus]
MSDNNYREMYVSEALEHVEIINQTLLQLEEKPDDRPYLDQIFRSAHTIKGMASTMGYDDTRELCKNIENIFDTLRNGEEKLTHHLTSALFACVDLLQQMISDEKLKVDLTPYLKKLENPEEEIDNIPIRESFVTTTSPTIRVKMSDLDSLVNLVGELLISKMRLEQTIQNENHEESKQVLMEVDRLITDLQYQSMQVRLVPINQVFSRFSRTVRDTSQKLEKKINLNMNGSGIELDRSVLDSITDPLLHILRNCVDHGIEFPDERLKSGKSETGNITLTAARKGENVLISIIDDGKGIDAERVKEKAVEKGIITQDEANRIPHQEAIQLIGAPGLSTAKEVTDVSGRGVGMDVVISQVESVGGSVKILSEKGNGTTMVLSLPLSLSIIRGLLIVVSEQRFVLPLSSIMTTLQIKPEKIFPIHGTEVIKLRDKIIPLIRLNKLLDIESKKIDDSKSTTVIIIENDGKNYGLVVDEFERNQDIVIKKLDKSESSNLFSNATILPDGKVALVIDPSLLIH